jgi:dihydrofolate synthase/folylpolyglutamate synthase
MNDEANKQLEIKLTFDQAYEYLSNDLSGANPNLFTKGVGLERSTQFFEELGNPQEQFSSIHIAGTSGKGTVAYIISDLLIKHGFHLGTHISPHVYDIRERCMLDGQLITPSEFARYVSSIIPTIKSLRNSSFGQPTYFEASVGVAFKVFADSKVDYAVIETGLGGLYDATNNIKRQDKLAVITTLGYDHTEILGNTLGEIAAQKAGILPYNGHAVVLKPDDAKALAAINKTARERNTEIELVVPGDLVTDHVKGSSDFSYKSAESYFKKLKLFRPGEHQVTNSVLAIKALEHLARRDDFKIKEEIVRDVIANVEMPGRFEKVNIFKQKYIFDGAHNPQKIQSLLDTLNSFGYDELVWVMALKKTKDIKAVFDTIKPFTNSLILTNFFSSQDGAGSQQPADLKELAKIANAAGIKNVEITDDNLQALKIAKEINQGKNKPIVVTGSFYLLGDLHSKLKL